MIHSHTHTYIHRGRGTEKKYKKTTNNELGLKLPKIELKNKEKKIINMQNESTLYIEDSLQSPMASQKISIQSKIIKFILKLSRSWWKRKKNFIFPQQRVLKKKNKNWKIYLKFRAQRQDRNKWNVSKLDKQKQNSSPISKYFHSTFLHLVLCLVHLMLFNIWLKACRKGGSSGSIIWFMMVHVELLFWIAAQSSLLLSLSLSLLWTVMAY